MRTRDPNYLPLYSGKSCAINIHVYKMKFERHKETAKVIDIRKKRESERKNKENMDETQIHCIDILI